jgi:3-oxoacyl-[acyl-carrier protein] reductase
MSATFAADALAGRNALVCGASSGIGRAIALGLEAAGARVWGLARRAEALEALRLAGVVVHDLEDLEGLPRALAGLPAIHVLVNNAGGPPAGPLLEARPEEFEQAFRRHVLASHRLVQMLLPGMVNENYGRIVNVISTSVREPLPGLGVSNTVRGAMASWAKTLAKELPSPITINNVLPGYTDTDRLGELKVSLGRRRGVPPEQVEREWLAAVPLGRLGRPEEIAALAVFLASPAASYVRGQSIAADGGRLGVI